jgi:CubicO group peptidase (beta-lactamase class C family)
MDVANKKQVDNKTLFCIGSISKVFTSIAIMQLHEKGKLDINKPLKDYIPEFKPLGSDEFINQITIASILSHESGLPSDDLSKFFNGKAFSSDEIISYFNNNYVCTKPYTINSYSNIGYALLGALVERVSGQAFATYIKQNITEPLGMKNSSFTMEEHMKPLLSKQYLKNSKEYNETQVQIIPAGGFYSNIEDMAIFAQMLINKGTLKNIQILKESTFQDMITVKNDKVRRDYDFRIGLTWFITFDGTWFKAGGSIWHGGDTRVFHSAITILPYQKLATIVLANSEKAAFVIPQINRMLLEKALEIKGIDTCFPRQYVSKPKTKTLITPQNFNAVAGTFSSFLGIMHIKPKSNALIVRINPIALVLKPLADSTFSVKLRVLGITFSNKNISKMWFDVVDNDTILVATSWDRDAYIAKKITPLKQEVLQQWKKEFGTYINIDKNLETMKTATLSIENNLIVFKSEYWGQKINSTLNPINNNMAIVNGLGRSTGDRIIFKEENGKTVMYFSGIKLQKTN